MNQETRLQRLRFRSWHRGMRELDLLLGKFSDNHITNFTPEQLDVFEAMLENENHVIFDWITGAKPTPEKYSVIVQELTSNAINASVILENIITTDGAR